MLKHCVDLEVRRQLAPSELPFPDGVFDLVTAVCVYHHIPDTDRSSFTAEVLRVLRPGGIFSIIEHNPVNPATRLIVARTPVDADAHLLMAGRAASLMAAAGARVMETRYFLYFPQRLHQYLSGLEDRLSSTPLGGQYAVFAAKP
jgi:SAM-dependent methyltransferase